MGTLTFAAKSVLAKFGGDLAPGSWTTSARDVWQEGIQFPCIKLAERGVMDYGETMVRQQLNTIPKTARLKYA